MSRGKAIDYDIISSAGPRERPLLLIDVDGVLSVFGSGAAALKLEAEIPDPEGDTFKIPNGTRQRVYRLQNLFQCVWATTHEHRAHTLLAKSLGITSHWPVLEWEHAVAGSTWKLPSVQKYASDRALAWVDDELFDDAYGWAEKRTAPTLLITTDPQQGLSENQVKQLESWAIQLSKSPAN